MIHGSIRRPRGVATILWHLVALAIIWSPPMFAASTSSDCASQPARAVEGQTVVSTLDPVARITIDKELVYLGAFRFELKGIACVERQVFAAVETGRIRRLFIIQFEGILDSSSEIYRWPMRDPIRLGDGDYRHNVFAFDTSVSIRDEPEAETARTDAFLKAKRLHLDSELVMSRFARVVGQDKKHELIFFYMEPLAGWRERVSDFDDGSPQTPKQREVAQHLTERSLHAFRVIP